MKIVLLVKPELANTLSRWCNEPPDQNVPKGEAVFDEEVVFPDGMRMAIQVVTSLDLKESCWTQGVLFTPKGTEMGCTDVGESFLGEYQVNGYVCEVKTYDNIPTS